MNMKNEELKKFIDDAFFLEHTIYGIYSKLGALERIKEQEQERQKYDFEEKEAEPVGIGTSIVTFILAEVVLAVLALAIVIISVLLNWITGADFFVMSNATITKLFILFLIIPPTFCILNFISNIIQNIEDKKKKEEYDAEEDERLKYVNEVVVPHIMIIEKKLKEECVLYETALDKLYGLNVIPEDCRTLEYVYIMQQYINKYKITDKKKLLNAVDKFFQHTDLQQDVDELSELLDSVQQSIIFSFKEFINKMECEIESVISSIELQNYDLEKIQIQSENESRKTELLLYWKLTE